MRDLSELTANRAVEITIHKWNFYNLTGGLWGCKIEHKEDGIKLEVETERKATLEEALNEAVDKYLAIRPGVPAFNGLMIEMQEPETPPSRPNHAANAVSAMDIDDEIPF